MNNLKLLCGQIFTVDIERIWVGGCQWLFGMNIFLHKGPARSGTLEVAQWLFSLLCML